MIKQLKIYLTLMLVNLFFWGCAHYDPAEICEALCLVSAATDAACDDTGDYLAPLANAYDTAQCLTSCDDTFEVYVDLNPICLHELYTEITSNDGCPDLASCF